MLTSGLPDALSDGVNALLWSLWTEIGVSGWDRHHEDWHVDVEPLVLFTSSFSNQDCRLKIEVLDWCRHYGKYVAVPRIENLILRWPSHSIDTWNVFAGVIQANGGPSFGVIGTPEKILLSGKSRLNPYKRPSAITLTIRAMFGVNARADVINTLVLRPDSFQTAAMITRSSYFTKRHIWRALEPFLDSGLLESRRTGNEIEVRLRNPGALAALIGPAPTIVPPWTAVFPALLSLLHDVPHLAGVSGVEGRVEVAAALRRAAPWLHSLPVPWVDEVPEPGVLIDWLMMFVQRLAIGDATLIRRQ